MSLFYLTHGEQIKQAIVEESFSLNKNNQTGAIQFSDKTGILNYREEEKTITVILIRDTTVEFWVFACLLAFTFKNKY